MRNNNYIVVAVGIGIFGVFAIFIALAIVASDNPEVARDEESVTPAVTSDNPEVAQDEESVTLAAWKYTVYGPVRLPEAISRVEANGAKGLVTIRHGKELGRLPIGQYHIRSWKTERKDDGGNTWALTGQYYGQDNPFEIKDGDQTRLDVGEPIIATVDARNVGSSYAFNQVIKGRRDEIIGLTRNGSRPQPPKVHIKNKDGSYEQTFNFQYG